MAAYIFLNICQTTLRHIPKDLESRINCSKCCCSRLFVHIRQPDSRRLVWGSFLTPFTPGIWMAIAMCIIVISATLMLVRKVWVGCHCKKAQNEICLYILQAIQFSFGAFCLQSLYTIWFWICSIASKSKKRYKTVVWLHRIDVTYISIFLLIWLHNNIICLLSVK